jgi:hypothetical protein
MRRTRTEAELKNFEQSVAKMSKNMRRVKELLLQIKEELEKEELNNGSYF